VSLPRIGLTLDLSEDGRRYLLKREYADAVAAAGGLPVLLCHAAGEALAEQVALLDGLVVTGGAFDVPPELYGEARRPGCGPSKPARTEAELAALRAALAAGLPVLGVCGGMQLLAVAHGATLWQDLATEAGAPGHEQPAPKDAPSHAVEVAGGTLLARLVGAGPLPVNSTHHQAVRQPGEALRVVARAPDGIVEAVEVAGRPFALGVQWHPEAVLRHEPRHARIYQGLVAAARERR
jgi:putative glutamine amidotransferase